MEHIKNIHLKNFTCFQDLKIENVNKINIIFGANGTGKTWLLRAIDLIVNFKHIQDINSNRDEISDFDEALLAIIKDFDNLISRKRISEILNKLGFFANSEFSISDDITQKEIGARISRIIRYPDHPRFYRRDRDDEYEFSSQHMMYVDGSWQNRVKMIVEELSNSDTKEEALREHIIKRFVPDLKTTKPHPTNGINVFLKDKPEQPLSLGLFGYGFQRSVISYMLCMLNKDSVLGIDEFENGLHFDKQSIFAKELIEASDKHNTQLFLTSHSDKSAILFLEEIKNAKQEHNFSAIELVKENDVILPVVYDFDSAYRILKRGINNPNDPFKLA